ncbi:MAG TPA: phenylalanine--tRNA ligase beta subunit-related protein [bacterium]|jgi:DNA/RNA-binding domain of Phe-tRNA-synthetase-like protein|nr:phenylalanine--tRNA ligase beta subunit-related protein [bacterium]HOX84847.1 phenylalanine--tRNA ligase beta subunit-related protein [bacterium]HPG44287.1 phenylalanine--tRNA ligase beta subunit-related protein [bacterium]HPM96654.1 phenylalanine--tRNA ligase beta subunit-related protein [bacterium]
MNDDHLTILLAEQLIDKLQLSAVVFDSVKNSAHSPELWQEIDLLCAQLALRFSEPAAAHEFFRPARLLYRSLGIDPTRYRPSSEALLRRALLGKPLYRVNTVVDIGNYLSLRFQLPVGIYDLDRLTPPLICRLGKEQEGYIGIQKGWINVNGKVVLADRKGPFGNPSSDSERSRIVLETTSILFVIYAPHPCDQLMAASDFTADLLNRFCGARRRQLDLIS